MTTKTPDRLARMLCECGCGQPAPIATETDSRRGQIKGAALRFINHHNVKLRINTIEHILMNLEPVTESGCLIWNGSIRSDGYCQVKWKQKMRFIHLIIYEHFKGPIPDGLEVDHICRVRCCANESHLEAVTPSENSIRRDAVRANCKNGHPLKALVRNGLNRNPARRCLICRKERDRQRWIKRKEQIRFA